MNSEDNDILCSEGKQIAKIETRIDGVNRITREAIIRKRIPTQRDLNGQTLQGQKLFYEEICKEISYKPTHHKLVEAQIGYFVYPTNFEVRQYQFDIVKRALFQNVLCAIPTGMGKTFIASTVMLNFFNWTEVGKIIFTAPTRPLVAQQIKACLGITGIPHDETAILLDKSRKNREQIWNDKRVFFTTPQVVENDLKRGVLDPKSIVCLVIDEAHRATGSHAYTNIVKFINRFNTSYRILALTATPGSNIEVVQEVVDNLEISRIESRTEESLDIARYMKRKRQKKVEVDLTVEIENIIEKLGIAILPVLQQAVELGIYEECTPSQINAFKAMQQSQRIVANPGLPEGIKWRNFFILLLLNHVGQMLKRIKIYGVRIFYTYFIDKYKEFTVKYNLGKSTNKTAAEFYYHPMLKSVIDDCKNLLESPKFLSHGKLAYMKDELYHFFSHNKADSRVIIFTELRESALEIVKFVDGLNHPQMKPHIFIGQAKGKEGFDEVSFTRKNTSKGRKKADRVKRQEEQKLVDERMKEQKKQEKMERQTSRTGSSEEAQLNGMTQAQQKQVIQDYKKGLYTVLVCTSIGEEGLDIGEVDLIICYDTTSSPIKNIQRMGRTGRKRDGQVVFLFSGNESLKFEQAMKDYSNLQKIIGQNILNFKKSDRILPLNIQPECRKIFITVSEEDKEVNEMEDTNDVIRFATQCMLGNRSKKKRKTNKREPSKKAAKRFFMPDDVDTGIVSAANLVNKIDEDNLPLNALKRNFPTLDSLQYDSTEYSSPSKSDFGEREGNNGSLEQKCKSLRNDLLKEDFNLDFPGHAHERMTSDACDTMSLGAKIERDEISPSSPIMKRRKTTADFAPAEQNESFVNCTVTQSPDIKSHNAMEKIADECFLTPKERNFFLQNYSSHQTVSIDTIPTLEKHTLSATVPHSSRNVALLKLFDDLNQGNKVKIIEMNRNKCVARALQSGTISFEDKDVSIVIKSQSLPHPTPKPPIDEPGILEFSNPSTVNLDELNEILGSDSDFEIT